LSIGDSVLRGTISSRTELLEFQAECDGYNPTQLAANAYPCTGLIANTSRVLKGDAFSGRSTCARYIRGADGAVYFAELVRVDIAGPSTADAGGAFAVPRLAGDSIDVVWRAGTQNAFGLLARAEIVFWTPQPLVGGLVCAATIGVTIVFGAWIVVITIGGGTRLANPVSARIAAGAFVEVVAFGLVECGETADGRIAGVICAGICVVTNGGIVADTYAVFTFVRVGTNVAVITGQRVVLGVFTGVVFKAFVEGAGVSVVAEVFICISIAIVVEAVANFWNRGFSNAGGFAVHTGDYALAGTMLVGDLTGDGCGRVVDDAVAVVVGPVANIFGGCEGVTDGQSARVSAVSISLTASQLIFDGTEGREFF
jgi:hypothetical protein